MTGARTIVALLGPTASGKTEVALALAERLPIVHASQAVQMRAPAKESLRMKESSIAVAARLVKEGEAAGLVSAGNTAAAKASTVLVPPAAGLPGRPHGDERRLCDRRRRASSWS